MAVSNQDYIEGLDPTGYVSISGAELLQMIKAAVPYSDKGQIITTTDVSGVADVPDATTTVKWKRYLWKRVTATAVIVYVWNDMGTTDFSGAGFQKWYSINISSIANGSVTNAMLAGSITSDKISQLDWSKLINVPNIILASTTLVGDVIGTPSATSIAAGAVVTTKILDSAVTAAKIASDAVTTVKILDANVTTDKIANLNVTEGKINTGAVTTTKMADLSVTIAKLNALVGAKLVQKVYTTAAAYVTSTTTLAISDTLPDTTSFDGYMALTFTPVALTNYVKVMFSGNFAHSTADQNYMIALGRTSSSLPSTDVMRLTMASNNNTTGTQLRTLEWTGLVSELVSALQSVSLDIKVATVAGTLYINGVPTATAGRRWGGALVSSLTIEEWRP